MTKGVAVSRGEVGPSRHTSASVSGYYVHTKREGLACMSKADNMLLVASYERYMLEKQMTLWSLSAQRKP